MAQGSDEVGILSAPTSDEIRSQIEQTRAEMSDTIDAIQSRLSPTRVLADARDSVTEATVGRMKRLPVLPVALVATVAAGLLVRALTNGKRRRRRQRLLRSAL
jgi:hypothetical protein